MSGAVPRAGWTLADGHNDTAWTTFPTLGTRVEVCLPGLPAERGRAVTGRVRCEIERIESRLSRFRPDSVIARLNREAWRQPCRVPDEECRLLRRCARFWQASGGSFDIALGAATDLWRAVGQGQRPPPAATSR
ncbi:MAG: FAD:protein FMN transferase [Acidobacteria bacterium]|nr:FAD:protein FMN transferase [Acidobacteriota bacterium]